MSWLAAPPSDQLSNRYVRLSLAVWVAGTETVVLNPIAAFALNGVVVAVPA